jgi:hypothetical protein
MAEVARRIPTTADLDALGEDVKAEILNGELVIQEGMTRPGHGFAQVRLSCDLGGPFDADGQGPAGPGGWWLLADVLGHLSPGNEVRPDLAGWLRARVPELPDDHPILARPDWVCEVLSPSNPELPGDVVRGP